MDGIGRFHAHLDICEQCREHPFNLCDVGDRLLHSAVEESTAEAANTKEYNENHPLGKKTSTITLEVKLQPCDIILWINDKNDPINRLSRWAIGQYCHVAMYLGNFPFATDNTVFIIPLVYESRGRGVYIASLLPQTGMSAAVMRLIAFYPGQKEKLLNTAFELAADEKHFYDYLAIVHSVLPRVIAEKLSWLPLPVKYQRDIFFICSEAVAELWWRNDTLILPDDYKDADGIHAGSIPLPGDFAKSPILKLVGTGKLMEDIVP